MHRRAATLRHYSRPSLSSGSDDHGVLRESPDENGEDALRRQLIEKDRENDRLRSQIQTLQAQLAARPPLEQVQEMEKEYNNIDLLLQGTQRENERCMSELERTKARNVMMEKELAKIVGENWQAVLGIAPNAFAARSAIVGSHQRAGSTPSLVSPPAPASGTPGAGPSTADTMAHIEQVRLLILGMEQRLQTREEKLLKSVERAEGEGARFEELRKEVLAAPPPVHV